MKQLHAHILNSNHELDGVLNNINSATSMANDYIVTNLSLTSNIDIIFYPDTTDAIPEMGISGWTNSSTRISIAIDPHNNPSTSDLFQTITHECCHAIRWQHNSEWSDNLFKALIFEGLAVYFEIKARQDTSQPPSFFQRYVLDNQNKAEQLVNQIKPILDQSDYNRHKIFITGNQELPRWAGYVAGYYLVNNYITNHNTDISKIYTLDYDEFRNFLTIN